MGSWVWSGTIRVTVLLQKMKPTIDFFKTYYIRSEVTLLHMP